MSTTSNGSDAEPTYSPEIRTLAYAMRNMSHKELCQAIVNIDEKAHKTGLKNGQFIAKSKLDTAVAETEKAYGGCHNCYGKGYATTISYTRGYGTDGDIGGYEGPVRHKDEVIRYCTCDRGKQLAQLKTNHRVEGE